MRGGARKAQQEPYQERESKHTVQGRENNKVDAPKQQFTKKRTRPAAAAPCRASTRQAASTSSLWNSACAASCRKRDIMGQRSSSQQGNKAQNRWAAAAARA
jgi:hypothetical protein